MPRPTPSPLGSQRAWACVASGLNLAVEGATSYEALRDLGPRIREAVHSDKFAALDNALNDR